MEIWRNIVGHGRQSEVSNLGRVKAPSMPGVKCSIVVVEL